MGDEHFMDVCLVTKSTQAHGAFVRAYVCVLLRPYTLRLCRAGPTSIAFGKAYRPVNAETSSPSDSSLLWIMQNALPP